MKIISYTDIKDKIEDTQNKIVNELSSFTIPCPYCGKGYHRIAQHAKKAHGISIPTFEETFHYTTATGALAYKILSLYAPKRDLYIQQYTDYSRGVVSSSYITLDANELKWDKYLTTKKIISHIRGTETYGGIFYPSASKVLVFDIDCYKKISSSQVKLGRLVWTPKKEEIKEIERAYAFEPTLLLRNALENSGIPPSCIHILYSGQKGFHIDLYFSDFISLEKLTSFGKYIIEKAYELGRNEWGYDFDDISIELRPESKNGRGVRFPLGIHRATGEVMCYCQRGVMNFPPVSDQYSYLLYKTKRIEKEEFLYEIYPSIINEKGNKKTHYDIPKAAPTASKDYGNNLGKAANNHRKCRHYKREELETFLEEGLKKDGTRHNVTVGLAILLKEKGHSQSKTFYELLKWSNEKLNGHSKSSFSEIIDDMTKIVSYTYGRDYHIAAPSDLRWMLTDADVRIIAAYPYLSLNEQITLAGMFMIRRHFGTDAYYPHALIAKLTGFSERTIRNHINKFIFLGILRQTYRGNSYQKTSNKYKIKDFQEFYLHALAFSFDKIDKKTFIKGLKSFVQKEVIKARYPWYIRKVKIKPVRMKGFKEVTHPEMPNEENSIPQVEPKDTQERIVGRKIFESSFFSPLIAIFSWLRKMKRKHGANFAKIYPTWRGYYMRC